MFAIIITVWFPTLVVLFQAVKNRAKLEPRAGVIALRILEKAAVYVEAGTTLNIATDVFITLGVGSERNAFSQQSLCRVVSTH